MVRILTLIALLLSTVSPFVLHAEEVRLITNRNHEHSGAVFPVTKQRISAPIYDLSFVAYDKNFAEEMDLAPEFVAEMDNGLRWMEVAMITEGQQTNCYYNIILDKSAAISLPKKNMELVDHPRPYLTWAFGAPAKNHPLFMRMPPDEMRSYDNKIGIGNDCELDPTKKVPCSSGNLLLRYYIQDRAAPYQILSMQGNCIGQARLMSSQTPMIWAANDPKMDYDHTLSIPPSHYTRYKIPDLIVKAIAPYMAEYSRLYFSSLSSNKTDIPKKDK